MEVLQQRLDAGEVLLLDGGTGTELEKRGARMDGVNWSGASVLMHPEIVRQVHEDYIRAGAEIIITNSFATSRHVLENSGVGHMFLKVNKQAATLAAQARDNCREEGVERPIYVAGSISTFNAGLDRQSKPPKSMATANYRDQAEILMEAGTDFIILEMVREIEPATHAVEGILAAGAPFWLGFSCQGARDGEPLLWDNKEETLAQAVDALSPMGASLLAVMHTLTEETATAFQTLSAHGSGPFGVYSHSGTFTMPHWNFRDMIPPQDYAAHALEWVKAGAQVVGGCCGIGPEHIQALREQLPATIPKKG
jgi:S-methylmethionine-dependent homocysteine/selenocysteine methylase